MSQRPDLAAMVVPLGRVLMQAELPVLESHGLSMWAYVVLLSLDDEPVRTQAAFAEAIGADKTRIIDVLDDLQGRGLISRVPDPADRRARLLALTDAGRTLRDAAQADIQRNEERLLALLPDAEKHRFLRTLQRLTKAAPGAFGSDER